MRNILVVFGGRSNENEISAVTGTLAANVLKKGGEAIAALYISPDGDFYTGEELTDIKTFADDGYKKCARAQVVKGGIYALSRRGKPKKFTPVDVALNCCHGGYGEGGGLDGLFLMNGIPLVGAGIFASSAFIDKRLTKIVLKGLGVRTPPYVYVREGESLAAAAKLLPAVVKPARLGSSIGVTAVKTEEELAEAFAAALHFDGAVIVEKLISPRREINCAAYRAGGEVILSGCEEAVASGSLLSFEDKYGGSGRSVYPADIPEECAEKIRATTKKIYTALGMRGIARFDFLVSGQDIYLLEVNTVPGSLAWYLLAENFGGFYEVLRAVADEELSAYAAEQKKRILHTGILRNIPANACKRGAK